MQMKGMATERANEQKEAKKLKEEGQQNQIRMQQMMKDRVNHYLH
jgi:hypothetical protein